MYVSSFFLIVVCVYDAGSVYEHCKLRCFKRSTEEPQIMNASHHKQIGSYTNYLNKKFFVDERCLEQQACTLVKLVQSFMESP